MLITLSRAAFGAPKMDTQNAAKLKHKLQKTTLFEKKNAIFFLRKKPLMVRFIFKPAYSHVAGARDFFSPETEFSLPVLSLFSRHLPAPFCSDGEGEVDFFVIPKTRFWPQTGRNVSAARAARA